MISLLFGLNILHLDVNCKLSLGKNQFLSIFMDFVLFYAILYFVILVPRQKDFQMNLQMLKIFLRI